MFRTIFYYFIIISIISSLWSCKRYINTTPSAINTVSHSLIITEDDDLIINSLANYLEFRLAVNWQHCKQFTYCMKSLTWKNSRLYTYKSTDTPVKFLNSQQLTLNLQTGHMYLGERQVGIWYGHPKIKKEGHYYQNSFKFTTPVRIDERNNTFKILAPNESENDQFLYKPFDRNLIGEVRGVETEYQLKIKWKRIWIYEKQSNPGAKNPFARMDWYIPPVFSHILVLDNFHRFDLIRLLSSSYKYYTYLNKEPLTFNTKDGNLYIGTIKVGEWLAQPSKMQNKRNKKGYRFTVRVLTDEKDNTIKFELPNQT